MYPLVAKVNLGDDVRRIYFDAGVERNLTWATLKQKIFDSFRKENPNLFTITYKDDEGDRVTITSDSEMSELLNYHTTLKKGTKFLYLTIHPRKDNSTPVYIDHSSELSHSSLRKSQTFKKSNPSTENVWEFKSSEPVTKKRTPPSSILSSSAHLPRSHANKPKTPSTDYDSDCSLRGTYLSDDSSPSPPDTPPSLRTKTTTSTTPIRKRPLKTTKGFFNISPRATTPPKTVPKSQKEISRPRFKHPPRPARAPFDPKKRQQTTPQRFNSAEKYTELKQLAENLTHEEEKMSFVPKSDETTSKFDVASKSVAASKSSTASGSAVASHKPSTSSVDNTQHAPISKNVETRSIACQTESVLVIPAGSLENLSGELAQLLIKEIRSGGFFVPPQNVSGLDVSWGPMVGRSGQYELSDADIPPQANEGLQNAIPDRSSSNIFQTPSPPPGGPGPQQQQGPATSQMMDDMSRSIADLSEEMRLLRQSIVMKESQQSSSSCSRSEGSTTFSTTSNSTSTSSFDNSSTSQTSSNQQTTSNNSSSTHLYQREGSTLDHAEKEGEGTTQYKSFDAYFSSTSDSDPSSVSSSSTAVTQEEEERTDGDDNDRTSSLSSSASSQKQGASKPNVEMFKSTDDISRIQKEVDSTFSSKSQSIEQLLETLTTMGFTNQVFNKVILQQNNCDLEEAISDLKSFYSKSSSGSV